MIAQLGADRELRVLGTGEGMPLNRIVRWTGEIGDVTSADVDAAQADFERFGGEAKLPSM